MVLIGALVPGGHRDAPHRRPSRFRRYGERRPKRAAQLFAKGMSQADVARQLDVSRQSVSRWHADWLSGGAASLRGWRRAGRLPELDQADLRRVERQLEKGPLENGYPTECGRYRRG